MPKVAKAKDVSSLSNGDGDIKKLRLLHSHTSLAGILHLGSSRLDHSSKSPNRSRSNSLSSTHGSTSLARSSSVVNRHSGGAGIVDRPHSPLNSPLLPRTHSIEHSLDRPARKLREPEIPTPQHKSSVAAIKERVHLRHHKSHDDSFDEHDDVHSLSSVDNHAPAIHVTALLGNHDSFITSLFNAMGSNSSDDKPKDTDDDAANHTFSSKLDFLLKPAKFGKSSRHSLNESIDNKSEQFLPSSDGESIGKNDHGSHGAMAGDAVHSSSASAVVEGSGYSSPAGARSETASAHGGAGGGSDDAISASNVQFASVRESPLQTLGAGNLSLHQFELASPAAALADASAGANNTSTVGRSNSVKNALKNNNRSSENVTLDESLEQPRGSVSPVPVNKQLPVSHQLLAVGQGDSKRSSRKLLAIDGAAPNLELQKSHSQSRRVLGEDFEPVDIVSIDEQEGSANLGDAGVNDYKEFKYASKKRNKEFHNNFRAIPRSERLIDDFSCAISKEILVQGRIYLSSRYICFNSNILGWVTNLIIPLQEVIQIEKKTTAGLFPNGMVIRTLHQKYVFATFISRDSVFSLISNVWHRVLLEGTDVDPRTITKSVSSRRTGKGSDDEDGELDSSNDLYMLELESDLESLSDSDDMVRETPRDTNSNVSGNSAGADADSGEKKATPSSGSGGTFNGLPMVGPQTHAATDNGYTKGANDTFICEETFNVPLGVVYEILFGEDTSKYVTILKEQKNFDVTEDTITLLSNTNKERKYSYIKPLGGPIGPKQTKCNITDTLVKYAPDSSVLIEQVSSTPDVPSGNSFLVKSKIFLSWGPKNSTKMYVVTSIEWSAKSWIKGAIEKGSIDGQKDSMKSLVQTVNKFISSATSSDTSGKNGANNLGKKKRKRRSTIRQGVPPVIEQESEKSKSIVEQATSLVESVGDLIPLNIPFLNNLFKGFLSILVFYFLLTSILGGFLNIVGLGSGGKEGISIDGTNMVSSIKINGREYHVVPTVDTTLHNERLKRNTEAALWDWIKDRSEGKIDINSSKTDGKIIDWNKDYSRVNDKYSRQEVEEMLEISKLKLKEIQEQLLRSQ